MCKSAHRHINTDNKVISFTRKLVRLTFLFTRSALLASVYVFVARRPFTSSSSSTSTLAAQTRRSGVRAFVRALTCAHMCCVRDGRPIGILRWDLRSIRSHVTAKTCKCVVRACVCRRGCAVCVSVSTCTSAKCTFCSGLLDRPTERATFHIAAFARVASIFSMQTLCVCVCV